MAEVIVKDAGTGAQGTMAQTSNQAQAVNANGVGADGQGQYGQGHFSTEANGSQGLSADLVKAEGSGIVRDKYDQAVVQMAFAANPMNASMRAMDPVNINSMVFGFYSVDLRKTDDALAAGVTALTKEQAGRTVPSRVTITVGDNTLFDVTDVILFEHEGYDADGNATPLVKLAARVCALKSSGSDYQLEVQFLNAKADLTLDEGTKIYILGHAAAEEDASTTPWMSLPEPTTQYMQKFMAQTLVSKVYQESNKEVDWTKDDVKATVLQQLLEDIERFYLFGVRSYTFDRTTKLHTRTCAGVLQQMLEGGSPVVYLDPAKLEFKDLLEAVRTTFIGNTGSTRRYMYNGSSVPVAIFGVKDLTKMVTIKEFNNFGYDFTSLDIMGYHLVNVPHPLLDKQGLSNYAIVIDRAYLKRAVFRSMSDNELELTKIGAYDGDSTVICEISAPMLKYPRAHALWIFAKDPAKP